MSSSALILFALLRVSLGTPGGSIFFQQRMFIECTMPQALINEYDWYGVLGVFVLGFPFHCAHGMLMYGSELSCNSAVWVVTLLEPHGPDLVTRGHYTYHKGGAT